MKAAASLRIVARRRAERDEWENTCRGCDYATFFHTPRWVDFFGQANGGAMVPAPETITFSDGTSAILPMACRRYRGGIVQLYWSMPAHMFGGWLSIDALTVEHAKLLAGYLQGLPDLVWRENPYDPILKSVELSSAREDFTQMIDLSEGFESAAQRFDYAHRKAVKKALAAGVSVAEAVRFEEWESYFKLYDASRARWQERNLLRWEGYSRPLFKAIYESAPSGRKLWLARVKGVPASGILCFYWNRHAVAWHGAGGAEFFMHRPNNLLYEHAIRHAAGAGYRWFDCNPSAGLAGVIEFKKHLGAIPLRSRIVEKKSSVRRLAKHLRDLLR
jgi:hypothetical protein